MMPIYVNGKFFHRAAGPLQRDFGGFRTPGLESALAFCGEDFMTGRILAELMFPTMPNVNYDRSGYKMAFAARTGFPASRIRAPMASFPNGACRQSACFRQ